MLAGVRELGLEVATPPRGAFYVFADARRFDPDSRRLALALLENAHVAITPGVDFGAAGEGFLRFSYAAADDTIRRALERMADFLRTRV
jgi:aspartate/methionine/tyrosine aminotransferase